MIIEVKGGDHTVCGPIKKELNNDEHVKIATYHIEHPLISSPEMIVETDGTQTPEESILAAISRLKKVNEKVKKDIIKDIK